MAWIRMIKSIPTPVMPPFIISDFTATTGAEQGGSHSNFIIDNNSLRVDLTSWAYNNQYLLRVDYNYPINVSTVSTMHIEGHRTITASADLGYAVIKLILQYSNDGINYTSLDPMELCGWYWTDNPTSSYNENIDISSYNYIKIRFTYHQLTEDDYNNKNVSYYLDAVSFS